MSTYTVKKGDNLWDIAQKKGVDFEELKRVNADQLKGNPDHIEKGWVIELPDRKVDTSKSSFQSGKTKRGPDMRSDPALGGYGELEQAITRQWREGRVDQIKAELQKDNLTPAKRTKLQNELKKLQELIAADETGGRSSATDDNSASASSSRTSPKYQSEAEWAYRAVVNPGASREKYENFTAQQDAQRLEMNRAGREAIGRSVSPEQAPVDLERQRRLANKFPEGSAERATLEKSAQFSEAAIDYHKQGK